LAGPSGRAFSPPKGMLVPAIHDLSPLQHRQSWMARPGFAVTGHTRSGAAPGKPQISWVFAAAAAEKTQKT
jgi:hypothetical protein